MAKRKKPPLPRLLKPLLLPLKRLPPRPLLPLLKRLPPRLLKPPRPLLKPRPLLLPLKPLPHRLPTPPRPLLTLPPQPPKKPRSNHYFLRQKKPASAGFFHLFLWTVMNPPQASSRQPNPSSWLATAIQSVEQFSTAASASCASAGRLFCSLKCAATTCWSRFVSICFNNVAA